MVRGTFNHVRLSNKLVPKRASSLLPSSSPSPATTTLYLPTPKITRKHRGELAKNAKKIADQIIVKMREAYSKAHRNLKKHEKKL